MNTDQINPYIRSAAFYSWYLNNKYMNVSYHMRFFAIRKYSAVIQCKDWKKNVQAETLLILRPGIPYDFQNSIQKERFDLYCCNFDLTQEYRDSKPFMIPVPEPDYRVENIVGSTDAFTQWDEPIVLPDCPELCRQVQDIYEIFTSGGPWAEEICSGIIKTILFRAIQLQYLQQTNQTSGSGEIAWKTMQYISEHFAEDIDEQSIAAAMNFHPYYLTRLTKRYYNTTPYRYLLQCRYEHGIKLLQNTNLSISEIASACGFLSQAHFAKVIRRQTGMSPSAIRKKNRSDGNSAV